MGHHMYEVHEVFIGMVHVPSATSSSLTAAIKDVLVHCILQLSTCPGQAYDGAANMMGHLRGGASSYKVGLCLLSKCTHCLARCLNRCV